jgi:hypothetical protein
VSRPANPYDNASCESFLKTSKREEIYARRYDNLEHLRANSEEFIEEDYHRQRLHSALGYRPPEEFERRTELSGQGEFRSATLRFFENNESGKNRTEVSELLVGEGDSLAVPFPEPHHPLEDARTLSSKREL